MTPSEEIIDLKLKLAACKQIYAELWQTASVLSEAAQTCLDNSHWEVEFGSTDLTTAIKAFNDLRVVKG